MLPLVLFYILFVNWGILGPYFIIKNKVDRFTIPVITWILDGCVIILIECLLGVGIL